MSLLKDKLPALNAPSKARALQWDAPADLLESYATVTPPANIANGNVIDVFDVIGEDIWGEGVSAKAVADSLAGMRGDITVRLNSPGGDLFDGVAIYNMLLRHDGRVDVQVLGFAASAASVIAMAGDTISMGPGSFMMVHNAWGLVVGNKNDMRAAADVFDQFDASMARLYSKRTGRPESEVVDIMNAETWMDAEAAVEAKFADLVEDALSVSASTKHREADQIAARRMVEAALAKAGVPRKERPEMISRAMEVAPRDASASNDAARDAGMCSTTDLAEIRSILKLTK